MLFHLPEQIAASQDSCSRQLPFTIVAVLSLEVCPDGMRWCEILASPLTVVTLGNLLSLSLICRMAEDIFFKSCLSSQTLSPVPDLCYGTPINEDLSAIEDAFLCRCKAGSRHLVPWMGHRGAWERAQDPAFKTDISDSACSICMPLVTFLDTLRRLCDSASLIGEMKRIVVSTQKVHRFIKY
jgi:hypothetical protein